MDNKTLLIQSYKDFTNRLYRYAYGHVRNKHDAEDVVSEAITRVLESKDITEIKDINQWVFGVARNVIKEKKRDYMKNDLPLEDNMNTKEYELSTDVVEEQMISEKIQSTVQEEMFDLPAKAKDVLILKLWENMKFNQIAVILEENVSTVKLRYYRALEKLKKKLEQKNIKQITIGLLIASMIQMIKKPAFSAPEALYLSTEKTMETNAGTAAAASTGVAMSTKLIVGVVGVAMISAGAAGVYVIQKDNIETEESYASSEIQEQSAESNDTSAAESNDASQEPLLFSYEVKYGDGTKTFQLYHPRDVEVKLKEKKDLYVDTFAERTCYFFEAVMENGALIDISYCDSGPYRGGLIDGDTDKKLITHDNGATIHRIQAHLSSSDEDVDTFYYTSPPHPCDLPEDGYGPTCYDIVSPMGENIIMSIELNTKKPDYEKALEITDEIAITVDLI